MRLHNKKRSAFSLIELSIVLIIIGLLISGVTGGASLIKSSELRSVITESRSWSVSVNSFFNQFDALPGDYDKTLGTQAGGDNDGAIEYDNDGSVGNGDFEGRNAWRHLAATNILDTSVIYSGGQSTATLASAGLPTAALASFGVFIPASKVGSAAWDFDHNSDSQNVVVLTGAIGLTASASNTLVNGTVVSTGIITPTDALSIDSKYDDGVANTGSIRAAGPNTSTLCFNSGTYVTSTSTKTCALSFRVDVNS